MTYARAQSVYSDAIATPINAYIIKTFRTLNRHKERGAFDHYAALRLLQNNLRDIPSARGLNATEREYVTRRLLQFWRLQWRDI